MNNHLAEWTGLTTLFGSLASVKLVNLIGSTAAWGWQLLLAVLTAICAALAVWAKQKMDDERTKRNASEKGQGQGPRP